MNESCHTCLKCACSGSVKGLCSTSLTWHCVAVSRNALQCLAMRCSMMQCVAARCIMDRVGSMSILAIHHPARGCDGGSKECRGGGSCVMGWIGWVREDRVGENREERREGERVGGRRGDIEGGREKMREEGGQGGRETKRKGGGREGMGDGGKDGRREREERGRLKADTG